MSSARVPASLAVLAVVIATAIAAVPAAAAPVPGTDVTYTTGPDFAKGALFNLEWIDHENPVWPGRVHYEAIGVDWQGPLDVASHQRSFDDTLAMLFAPRRLPN